jgi:hypothetical protein
VTRLKAEHNQKNAFWDLADSSWGRRASTRSAWRLRMWAAQEDDRGAKGALTACWWGSSTASPPWVLTLIWGVMDVINLIHGAMIVS